VLGIAGCDPEDTVHAAKASPSASHARPSTSSHPRTSAAHTTSKHAAPTTSHRAAPKTTSAPAPKPATKKPAPTRSSSSPRANCDSAYPDACLHDGIGDYDCAGGSGNGPNYIGGPIEVRAPDPFGLDADHDGVGCES
jgi:hypothetical protein